MIPVFALSFAEYMEFKKSTGRAPKELLTEYIRMGGFPIAARSDFVQVCRNLPEESGREVDNLMAGLCVTHIGVIERGCKVPRLETSISIANALEVSADSLLAGLVDKAADGVESELTKELAKLLPKDRARLISMI